MTKSEQMWACFDGGGLVLEGSVSYWRDTAKREAEWHCSMPWRAIRRKWGWRLGKVTVTWEEDA